jgi:hypothetical protein
MYCKKPYFTWLLQVDLGLDLDPSSIKHGPMD